MADSDTIIRAAAPTDAPNLAELAARTFHTAFAAKNNPEDIATYVAEAFGVDKILQELNDPCCRFLLAIADGVMVGYAKIYKGEPPTCVDGPKPIELARIYVDAKHQSGGIGATLMQAVLDYAKKKDYRTVWLGAWEKNPDARRFYERQGFSAVGSKYFMVGNDRQNDVVMSRQLD